MAYLIDFVLPLFPPSPYGKDSRSLHTRRQYAKAIAYLQSSRWRAQYPTPVVQDALPTHILALEPK